MEYTNTREKITDAIQYDGNADDLSEFLDIPLEEFERVPLEKGKVNVLLTVRDGIDSFSTLSINIGDYVIKTPNIKVIDKKDFELEYSPSPYYKIRNNLLFAKERLVEDGDRLQDFINIEHAKKLKKQGYNKANLDWLISQRSAIDITLNEFNRVLRI